MHDGVIGKMDLVRMRDEMGDECFLIHVKNADIETTLEGAKYIRQVKLDYKPKTKVPVKKKRIRHYRGNLRKI